jgi:hypothetical protein
VVNIFIAYPNSSIVDFLFSIYSPSPLISLISSCYFSYIYLFSCSSFLSYSYFWFNIFWFRLVTTCEFSYPFWFIVYWYSYAYCSIFFLSYSICYFNSLFSFLEVWRFWSKIYFCLLSATNSSNIFLVSYIV